MKALKKFIAVVFLATTIASFFSISAFATGPQLTNSAVSSLVAGKNVIAVNNTANKFVTNASSVRVSFTIQDPNGTISWGRVKFYGEQAMSDQYINYSGIPNQYYVDWTIPDISNFTRDCRLVIYCTDVATGTENIVEQPIDIKYSSKSVIAEPISTSISDFGGENFYVSSILYDLTFSGMNNVSFDFAKYAVPYTQKNYASISSMSNNTYYCGVTLSTSSWSNEAGEYRVSLYAYTNSTSCIVSVMRSVYLNSPNMAPTLYQDPYYSGTKAYVEDCYPSWETGNYNLADLIAKNMYANTISSIIVPAGYMITVYDGDFFTGSSCTFYEGSYNLSSYGWDNSIESIKVEKISEL